jgi:DNA-binding MarR family transcriptional regulator
MARRSRGGKGGHEPGPRIQTRQARAWELSVQGWTQREIARELGVSQAAVSRMLDRVGRQMWRDLSTKGEVHVARQFAQLNALDRDVTASWEQSKREQTRRRHQRVDSAGDASAGAGGRTVTEAVATSREGDPRFSAQRLQISKERRALIERFVRPGPDRSGQRFDPEALVDQLARTMTLEELKTLEQFAKVKQLNWSAGERALFDGLSPEALERLAAIKRKGARGDYDED